MKIELYIKSKEGAVKGAGAGKLPGLGWARQQWDPQLRVKLAFVDISENERKLIELLDRLAGQHNVEMKIFDIARSRYALRAFFKGIRITPTVIIGRNKLSGNITEEQIVKVLKESLE